MARPPAGKGRQKEKNGNLSQRIPDPPDVRQRLPGGGCKRPAVDRQRAERQPGAHFAGPAGERTFAGGAKKHFHNPRRRGPLRRIGGFAAGLPGHYLRRPN